MIHAAVLRGLTPVLAAVLATASVAAPADQSTEWRTKKVEKRRFANKDAARMLISYTRCVADRRYAQAKTVLEAADGSSERAKALKALLPRTEDTCFGGGFGAIRMQMKPSMLVGGIAQAMVLKHYPDLARVIPSEPTDPAVEADIVKRIGGGEAYGRCLVRRDPAGAFALLSSGYSTPEEGAAFKSLSDDLSACLAMNQTTEMDKLFIRGLVAQASYRLATEAPPRPIVAGVAR